MRRIHHTRGGQQEICLVEAMLDLTPSLHFYLCIFPSVTYCEVLSSVNYICFLLIYSSLFQCEH